MEQRRLFSRLTAGAALGLIHAYRAVTRSGVFPLAGRCRFTPTCSEYCAQAIIVHGPWRGLVLGLRRLLSCHPFSSRFGYDPVTKP